MNKLAAIAILLFTLNLKAQKPAEIGLITDNDLYTSPVNDRYYTNGIEFFYRYLGNSNNEKVAKKITEFRVGQYMYNPQTPDVEEIWFHDRPFAGYLFAEAGINTFYKNQDVFKMNLQAGVVGPEAGAEQLQKLIHKTFGYGEVRGWQYQIKTTAALQGQLIYSKKILADKFKERTDINIQAEVDIGTVWVGASIGPLARLSLKGPLQPVYNSALHGASLNKDPDARKEQREFFVYVNPSLNYQRYDATIQGSMFNNDSPVVFNLIPFRFNAEAGIKYTKNHWNYAYTFVYRGKELSNNVVTGYYYGSISLSYMP
jgi:lipid A 3-O-deacylase